VRHYDGKAIGILNVDYIIKSKNWIYCGNKALDLLYNI